MKEKFERDNGLMFSIILTWGVGFIFGMFIFEVMTRSIITPILLVIISVALTVLLWRLAIRSSVSNCHAYMEEQSERIRKETQEKNEIEWNHAMFLAKEIEPRITTKLSYILLKEVQSSFSEEKMRAKVEIKRREIKADHILKVFNELFEEEEKES